MSPLKSTLGRRVTVRSELAYPRRLEQWRCEINHHDYLYDVRGAPETTDAEVGRKYLRVGDTVIVRRAAGERDFLALICARS